MCLLCQAGQDKRIIENRIMGLPCGEREKDQTPAGMPHPYPQVEKCQKHREFCTGICECPSTGFRAKLDCESKTNLELGPGKDVGKGEAGMPVARCEERLGFWERC